MTFSRIKSKVWAVHLLGANASRRVIQWHQQFTNDRVNKNAFQ